MSRIVETVAVGTELLLGQIANTNAQELARVLAEHGALHYHQVVVGDNRGRLVAALRQALDRADMVVTIGGLGPTLDDLTKEAVAEVFGRRLVLDEPSWERIVRRLGARGRTPTPNNRRQAELPEGAVAIPNEHGTAPGVLLEAEWVPTGGGAPVPRVVVCLPGPPQEFVPMARGFLADYLERWVPGPEGRIVLRSRSLRVAGIGESEVEHRLRDLVTHENPTVATYAQPGEVEVRLTARAGAPQEAEALLAPLEAEVRRRLDPWVYGEGADTLGGAVVRAFAERGLTLAVAESCTGGLLSERLTATPGASRAFVLGVVAYANEAKERALGVPAEALARWGAVSEPVARAMAEGVRRLGGASVGVGITGVAGPDGGTPAKPVGTVFVALAAAEGTWCRALSLTGDRAAIRRRASQEALVALRRYALAPGDPFAPPA